MGHCIPTVYYKCRTVRVQNSNKVNLGRQGNVHVITETNTDIFFLQATTDNLQVNCQ